MTKSNLYRFLRPILTFLMKLIFKPKIIGKENIPKNGSMVLAGNHTNILDPVLLLSSTKRTVHFLAKIELVEGPLGFGFKHMGIIPVNRRIKDKSVMPAAEEGLKAGKIIGVFPEGTINRTDDITMPFKTGAVRMAYGTNTKIIPFAITGKYHIFKGPVIIFGKPYKVGEDITKENEKLKENVIKLIKEGSNYGKNK